jgi:hypothetical protein
MEEIEVYKIRSPIGTYIVEEIDLLSFSEEIDNLYIDEEILIKKVRMSQVDYDNLPEFEG